MAKNKSNTNRHFSHNNKDYVVSRIFRLLSFQKKEIIHKDTQPIIQDWFDEKYGSLVPSGFLTEKEYQEAKAMFKPAFEWKVAQELAASHKNSLKL